MQEVTFHPHINQHSLEIMQERRGSNGAASFLNRLEADQHGRKIRLQVRTSLALTMCNIRNNLLYNLHIHIMLVLVIVTMFKLVLFPPIT